MTDRLAPGALLAVTAWRFGTSPRFARRILPWSDYNARTTAPIDVAQLDPGDHLLHFGASDGPARYCHHCDDGELKELVASVIAEEITLADDFEADGRSEDLNRYLVFERSPAPKGPLQGARLGAEERGAR